MVVFPETVTEYIKEAVSKISLLARNILRRVIRPEGWMVKIFSLLSFLADSCHLKLLLFSDGSYFQMFSGLLSLHVSVTPGNQAALNCKKCWL